MEEGVQEVEKCPTPDFHTWYGNSSVQHVWVPFLGMGGADDPASQFLPALQGRPPLTIFNSVKYHLWQTLLK